MTPLVAEMPLARTLFRVATSGRLNLARQTLLERRAWPATLDSRFEGQNLAVVENMVHGALEWIALAQAAAGCGGIPASYCARREAYEWAYPETTGYTIPTLHAATDALNFEDGDEIAAQAADWLRSRQQASGAVRCNIEPPQTRQQEPSQIIMFDCGAILQGFTAMVRRGAQFGDSASTLASFIADTQSSDGTWKRHLAFNHFGSHNALVAFALIDAGITLNVPRFTLAGHKGLAAIRKRFRANGYIEGCVFPGVRDDVAFLHPFVYTIEGFLKAEHCAPGHGYLEAVLPSLDALFRAVRRDQRVPGAFVREDMTTAFPFTALTAIAQLADVGFKADRLTGQVRYAHTALSLMQFLRRVMAQTLKDPGWSGGLPSAFPIDGEYLPFRVNNWGTKYLVDAGLEERRTLLRTDAPQTIDLRWPEVAEHPASQPQMPEKERAS